MFGFLCVNGGGPIVVTQHSMDHQFFFDHQHHDHCPIQIHLGTISKV